MRTSPPRAALAGAGGGGRCCFVCSDTKHRGRGPQAVGESPGPTCRPGPQLLSPAPEM
jgi:hypothetical protein